MTKHTLWLFFYSTPIIWLIYHLFMIGFVAIDQLVGKKSGFYLLASMGALSEFYWYRNRYYIGYLLMFGLMTVIRVMQAKSIKTSGIPQQSIDLTIYIPILIPLLLLTTFSYAIAGMLIDFVYLFR